MKLRTKITIVLLLVSWGTITYLSSIFARKMLEAQLTELRQNLSGLAAAASLLIDGDKHELLRSTSDMTTANYQEIYEKLLTLKKYHPKIKYIYTLRPTDVENIYEFVVDATEPKDENKDGKIDKLEDITPLGEKYDISPYPEMQKAIYGPIADKEISADKWGWWLSGYAPIYNSKKEAVGIVGLDVSAKSIRQEQNKLKIQILGWYLTAVLLSVFLSFFLSKHLTTPIQRLISGVREITSGNLKYRLQLIRNDEIGELALKFNHMAEHLSTNIQKLSTLNQAATLLASSLDLNQTLKTSLKLLAEVLQATRCLIFLNSSDNSRIETVLAENINNVKIVDNECFLDLSKFDTRIPADFLLFIQQKPKIYSLTELKEYPQVCEWLTVSKCNYLAPLIVQSNLRGFVLLAAEKIEIDFATTFIQQIALALENARLYNEAVTDGLTGLYIHRYFQMQLENEILRAKRYGGKFSLLLLDIDHFKKINDTQGHQIGDIILKTISQILKNLVRQVDLVARYGGEEIAIILPETGIEQAKQVAERIRTIIERYKFPNEISVTTSIGLTGFDPKNPKDKSQLIAEADAALYRAKNLGRNRVEIAV